MRASSSGKPRLRQQFLLGLPNRFDGQEQRKFCGGAMFCFAKRADLRAAVAVKFFTRDAGESRLAHAC